MSFSLKIQRVQQDAVALAEKGLSWVDLSNRLFHQTHGLVAKAFPDQMERQAFLDTEEYRRINALVLDAMKSQGIVEGAKTSKSGRFVVRVPKSLHEALDVEAKNEGVSLNQLVVSKLAWSLRERVDISTALIVEAFRDVHSGYATDRVVVDPKLNARFLKRCRDLGLEYSDYHLNHALFDIRKSSKATLPATTKRTEYRDFDLYQFGSEIAVRTLQRTEGASLDRILCDPELASEFDAISSRFVNEPSALKRRWAALNLRKTRRLQKMDLTAPTYELVSAGPLRSIPVGNIPAEAATYALFDQNRPMFAGETDNLRKRMEIHLQPGRLPSWLDLNSLTLRHFVVSKTNATDRQKWLRKFIHEEHPVLNYQKSA